MTPLRPPDWKPPRVQFVWWCLRPESRWIGVGRSHGFAGPGRMFKWRLRLGIVEIRRWRRG